MAETILGKVCPTPKGVYNATAKYEKLDIIQHDGNGYMVLKECTGVLPSEGEYYMLLSARGSDGTNGSDGTAGADGKSAYQAAVEAGYTGTETEFAALMNSIADKQDTLTGLPGQVVGFDTSGAALAVQGWSNPNLGINCDFRRPVNRNGRGEYTAAGMTIDRWRLSMSAPGISVRVLPEGISIDKTQADVYGRIAQSLDNPGSLSGATVTVSILAKGDTTPYLLLFLNGESSGVGLVNIPLTDEYSLYSRTLTLRGGDITRVDAAVGYQTSSPAGSCALLGLKIDMGTRQTLAHQEEDGRWVLNSPPDYALQYALCSLYSPITGAFVGSRYSNGNLLDNGRFSINQRAQKSYTGAGYGIDRWISVSAGLTVTVNDDGTITLTNSGDTLAYYRQRLEVHLGPRDYTLSTLVMASDPKSGHNAMYCCYDDDTFSSVVYLDAPGLYAVTSARNTGKNIFRAQYNIAPGGSLTLCAAKLETGLVQTLAHRDEAGNWVLSDPPPNRALELAKCQRYQQVFRDYSFLGVGIAQANHKVQISIPTPVTMRSHNVACSGRGLGFFDGAIIYDILSVDVAAACNAGSAKFDITVDSSVPVKTVGVLFIRDINGSLILDANL